MLFNHPFRNSYLFDDDFGKPLAFGLKEFEQRVSPFETGTQKAFGLEDATLHDRV